MKEIFEKYIIALTCSSINHLKWSWMFCFNSWTNTPKPYNSNSDATQFFPKLNIRQISNKTW